MVDVVPHLDRSFSSSTVPFRNLLKIPEENEEAKVRAGDTMWTCSPNSTILPALLVYPRGPSPQTRKTWPKP